MSHYSTLLKHKETSKNLARKERNWLKGNTKKIKAKIYYEYFFYIFLSQFFFLCPSFVSSKQILILRISVHNQNSMSRCSIWSKLHSTIQQCTTSHPRSRVWLRLEFNGGPDFLAVLKYLLSHTKMYIYFFTLSNIWE